jgi:hypothetical protein
MRIWRIVANSHQVVVCLGSAQVLHMQIVQAQVGAAPADEPVDDRQLALRSACAADAKGALRVTEEQFPAGSTGEDCTEAVHSSCGSCGHSTSHCL